MPDAQERTPGVEPAFTDDEARALRLILGLGVGRDGISAEVKKFLDGKPNKVPTKLQGMLTEAATVISVSVAASGERCPHDGTSLIQSLPDRAPVVMYFKCSNTPAHVYRAILDDAQVAVADLGRCADDLT